MTTTYEQSKSLSPGQAGASNRAIAASPPITFGWFVLAALILTYPLLFHLFSHIPRGSEAAGTVPYFNLWTLQWNIDQLLRGYPGYWHAPIFAPHRGTFAFSESELVSGLLAAPLWLAFGSPALAYNVLLLLFLTLNGWFSYGLMRRWGVSHLAALLSGLFVQFLPFVAQEMGVLQLIALFGFLWSLRFLQQFLHEQQQPAGQAAWRTNLALALGAPVTFFTCSYYGLFSLLFLPLAFVLQLRRAHLRLKVWAQLLAIGLISLALSGPFLWGQQQQLASYGFSRGDKIVANNSARLIDYTHFLDNNLFYGQILGLKSGLGQRLFPGLGLILLASIGLMDLSGRRAKIYLLAAIILALLLSLGLRLEVAGRQPYQWLRDYLPGFAELRSPFRFAVFVQLHLALLAGFGLHHLERRFSPHKASILAAVSAFVLIEALALPLPLQAAPTLQTAAPWQVWLNRHAPQARIVLLPFAATSSAVDFEQTTRWMLANRHLQGDMLNGYSGFFPSDHGLLRQHMLQFPTAEGIALLREKGAHYVVVDYALPAAPAQAALEAYLPLVYRDASSRVAIYALSLNR